MGSRLSTGGGKAKPKFDNAEIVFEEGIDTYALPSKPIQNSETLWTPTYILEKGTDYELVDNTVTFLASDFCQLLTTGFIINAKWSY